MNHKILLDAITPEDRITMEAFIEKYGVIKDNFIGLDKWLQFWSYSNQKLFKLLGGKLIHKIDFSYEKDRSLLIFEIREKFFNEPFKANYHAFYNQIVKTKYYNNGLMDEETRAAFSSLSDVDNFINDKVEKPIRWRRPGSKSMLQIQTGMKPMRAFQKVINYFKEEYSFVGFEDFRIAHSMILNDKYIKGKLCISIHPMDFLTMSDNASDWSSCMSWKMDGCYHLGTVEMMNSNNVVCCYIEGKNPFEFKDKDDNCYFWNNKKFRVLFYVTKDIIVSGKAYPYQNVPVEKTILEELKNLALINWNRSYTFGPELYKDMIHINYGGDMLRNKNWIATNNTTKHNIIFDTNAMYNDMFNDNCREYWCYRNKVKRNKIINISGKANCLCCNQTVWEETGENYDYNERYQETGNTVCLSCSSKYQCTICGSTRLNQRNYKITLNGKVQSICERCFQSYIKICPDCGKPFTWKTQTYRNNDSRIYYYHNAANTPLINGLDYFECKPLSSDSKKEYLKDIEFFKDDKRSFFEEIYFHKDCLSNYEDEIKNIKPREDRFFGWRSIEPVHVIENSKVKKFLYWNLKTPEYVPEMIIDSNEESV